MNRRIVAFGASNSRQSINKKLASFAAQQVENVEVEILDLNDFEMPIYSIDRESESGVPVQATAFRERIRAADALVISFAEHNGAYTAAFKNIFDWMSRLDNKVWENKPMFILSTSPGPRGGKTVLEIAVNKFKRMSKSTVASFSLPSFAQNFSPDGIKNEELARAFDEQLRIFTAAL